MRTSSRSTRRHRNPEKTQKKASPFFAAENKSEKQAGNAFYQSKLSIGEPGDKYEREADAVADKAVNRQQTAAITGQPGNAISTVQKSEMPEKEKEKPIQKMEDEGMKEKEKPIQKKESPLKEKEKKPIQKKEEHEKHASADEVLDSKKEKEEKPAIMAKREANHETVAGNGFEEKLASSKGKGQPLPIEINNEMSQSIGADFSGVDIHTGEEASALAKEAGAQAFAYGNHIYFNDGKFNPQTAGGKHLLAHELTHTVQQGAAPRMSGTAPGPGAAASVQREISTPLPEGVQADKQSKVAKFSAGGFSIKILPDITLRKGDKRVKPGGAKTFGTIDARYNAKMENGKVVSVVITKTLAIQTMYASDAKSTMDSAYGRGSIKTDKEAGHGSLGFHEGSHGSDYIEYVKSNPFPEIAITSPITQKEFKALVETWDKERKEYNDAMQAKSIQDTDEVKDPVE